MTSPEQNDLAASSKRRQGRSPSYPFIPLKRALEQAKALYDAEGKYAVPLPSAYKAWGYGGNSSGARQTLAALKYFGLIDVEGQGNGRKIKVGELALRALLDQREDRSEYNRLLRTFAMNPTIHQKLYEEYPTGLPSDATVEHYLVFECDFNEGAASEVLDEFKQTSELVGLFKPESDQDEIPGVELTSIDSDISVGNYVQWEQQGDLKLPEPWEVSQIDTDPADGKKYLLCRSPDGVEQGYIPYEEAIVEQQNPRIIRPTFAPPKANIKPSEEDVPAPKGYRKATFPLTDGDVTIVYPEGLSEDGYSDLEGFIGVFMRKVKREAGVRD